MNPFRYECTCEVCGGHGVSRTPYWFQRHVDPRICSAVLAARAQERARARPAPPPPPEWPPVLPSTF